MNNFEETLANIDVFCKVLVRKMIKDDDCSAEPELIENLLRRKYAVEVHEDYDWLKEPLIDVFEDEEQIKILVQHQCKNWEIAIRPYEDYVEIWVDESKKIKLPINRLDINDAVIKRNNQAVEITILKRKMLLDAQSKYPALNVK
ncbi:hypothetical protein KEJ34_07520 [Candidatus Bathyarchaeota archaeon]|nr:hypothetical protein [Candidatus Bathyarchaeota archaeon]